MCIWASILQLVKLSDSTHFYNHTLLNILSSSFFPNATIVGLPCGHVVGFFVRYNCRTNSSICPIVQDAPALIAPRHAMLLLTLSNIADSSLTRPPATISEIISVSYTHLTLPTK